ncbi:GNAT family N-acetyltransferase [Lactiplantibacillus plantarum]|uniref:GNAT family N-acetyltransferase n=1 Tax=Lactiplantibacillus plantarum TaxID=1590 RepID=UPI001BA6C11C|nr:GNAT family N-acetyltransferase [Lactiplantibacillus plantarum]MBS0935681.1 GNAT family N-acetyltransferase [Lactiplantibacillus plantarum]MBS0943962.1 GNAT family N-acetyltransferase [Lactiplantibacillus plantarum]
MIRDLKIEDSKELKSINKEQLGYDFPMDLTKDKLTKLLKDPSHHFFKGFEDETSHKILGYVHAEVYETIYFNTMFNVLALAVSKENEKQGIGEKLMKALEEEARNRRYEAIRLNSGMTREGAHKFYEKIGYNNNKNQKRFIKFVD